MVGIGGGTLFTPYFKASAAIGLPVSMAGALVMAGRAGASRVTNGPLVI